MTAKALTALEGGTGGPVDFKGREVDLAGFFDAMPYDEHRWAASVRHDALYFLVKKDNTTRVYRSSLGGLDQPADITKAMPSCLGDLSDCLTFGWRVNEWDGSLYFLKDEGNNESFNLHRVVGDQLIKLTSVPYIYGYGFNPTGDAVAYSNRMGKEGAPTQIHILDLGSLTDRVVAIDTPEQRVTWGHLSWSVDCSRIVLCTTSGGDRCKANLSVIATNGAVEQKLLCVTDPSAPRTFAEPTQHWLGEETLVAALAEGGARNLSAINIKNRRLCALTNFGSDVHHGGPGHPSFAHIAVVPSSEPDLLAITTGPFGSSIWRVSTAHVLHSVQISPMPVELFHDDATLTLLDPFTPSSDAHSRELLVHVRSPTTPLRVDCIAFSVDANSTQRCTRRERVVLPESVMHRVVHSTAERVLCDTFDDVPMTVGEYTFAGKIHGFLFTPLHPLPPDERLLAVQAMYGGDNKFDCHIQILCAAGIHVFSPAPRGSGCINATFQALGDGALGQREVLDVMYTTRGIAERLGIPPHRCGVFGHSLGGYEVLRQVTFGEEFCWGFGIAESAFACIKSQYDDCNIKGWIVKIAGDPATIGTLERWIERSPLNHAQRLECPLLLIHGTADQRITFAGSQSMHDRLVAVGKSELVTLIPLDGVGHEAVSPRDIHRRYTVWFEFLAGLPREVSLAPRRES